MSSKYWYYFMYVRGEVDEDGFVEFSVRSFLFFIVQKDGERAPKNLLVQISRNVN
ncbi:hypothetical protein JKA74_06000 [Marivirga sp. S37H4]|uniref:Uncharacterized protein n=1 Tax=Marivirga aurantiaca TaxID=2802615 RepID=A0A934WXB8_9BACT|nr:hypothetical protein [Marivirga aurantiaca]MBK6264585.1 hypothetical protein [Marivirga aurantiaca]